MRQVHTASIILSQKLHSVTGRWSRSGVGIFLSHIAIYSRSRDWGTEKNMLLR